MITPPILWWSADLADRRRHDDEFATGVITEVDRMYFLATDAGWAALNELPADARRLVVDTTGQAPADDTAAPDDSVRAPRELLESLVDGDDCWFDHHGGCQAHGYLSLQPGELCPQTELKQLLATQPTPTTGDTETADA